MTDKQKLEEIDGRLKACLKEAEKDESRKQKSHGQYHFNRGKLSGISMLETEILLIINA